MTFDELFSALALNGFATLSDIAGLALTSLLVLAMCFFILT